jgi:hypothetical protein
MYSTFRTSFLLFLAVSVLATLSASAAFGNVDRSVPFHGSAETLDYMLPVDDDCPADSMWRYLGVGSGSFTHVGSVEFSITHCSKMTSETRGAFGPGSATITAPNGDVLTLTTWGTFDLVFGPTGPQYSDVALEWEVAGGTGRFVEAAGSGTATALGDLAAETTAADFVGTIAYRAANRSIR